MMFDRESGTTDALLTDLYLDALLAGVVLGAASSGAPADPSSQLDPAARKAADRLRRDLVRVHPSFRFEERLATRLAEAAVAMRVPAVAGGGGGGRVVAFRAGPSGDPDPDALIPAMAGNRAEDGAENEAMMLSTDPIGASGGIDATGRRVPTRPFLIGGALTSAALSIAGAAFVAWRLGRPGRPSTPMGRAARAVREARLAAALEGVGSAVNAVNAVTRRVD